MSFPPYQKKLLKEPQKPQKIISDFILKTLNRITLINYEHVILSGVIHGINEIRMIAKLEKYELEDEKINRISIDFIRESPRPFVSGSIKIPIGHLMSVMVNLHKIERKLYPEAILPIDIYINYGVFTKKSGIIRASRVGTIIFKLSLKTSKQFILRERRVSSLAKEYPKIFYIFEEEEEEEKSMEIGKGEFGRFAWYD